MKKYAWQLSLISLIFILTTCQDKSPVETPVSETDDSAEMKRHLEEVLEKIQESALDNEQKEQISGALSQAISLTRPGYLKDPEFIASMKLFANGVEKAGFNFESYQELGIALGIPLWKALCLGELVTCLKLGGGEAFCSKLFRQCLEHCPEGFGMGPGSEVGGPDCTSSCQQVKRELSAPRVTINPVGDCNNPPSISAAEAAFFDKAKDDYGYDWKDDPANACGDDCHCSGSGGGTLTASERIRFNVSVTIDGCEVTGSISVLVEKYRREAECMPNG